MNFEKINTIVRSKTADLKDKLIQRQNALGMKHGPNPLTKITTTVKEKNGIAERIRIRFKRSGVFVHKGVGRGTTAEQVGSTKRRAKEWFDPVVEPFADELANEVADEMVELTFNNLLIK